MIVRKKGYPVMLALTVILTVGGIAALLLPESSLPFEQVNQHVRLGITLGLLVLAGAVCTIRKRFFTEVS